MSCAKYLKKWHFGREKNAVDTRVVSWTGSAKDKGGQDVAVALLELLCGCGRREHRLQCEAYLKSRIIAIVTLCHAIVEGVMSLFKAFVCFFFEKKQTHLTHHHSKSSPFQTPLKRLHAWHRRNSPKPVFSPLLTREKDSGNQYTTMGRTKCQ